MTKILALDLATTTGYALGRIGGAPSSGQKRIGSEGDSLGAFADEFDFWLNGIVERLAPGLIYYEAPINQSGKTTAATTIKLRGLAYHVHMIGFRHRIIVRPGNVQTVRREFCGSGHASKDQVVEECRRRGWSVAGTDEADAVALWWWACEDQAKWTGARPQPQTTGAAA